MADIFLSYATEDRARAKSLAESLELRGWAVWWDKKIPLGTSFDQVIEEAIGAAGIIRDDGPPYVIRKARGGSSRSSSATLSAFSG